MLVAQDPARSRDPRIALDLEVRPAPAVQVRELLLERLGVGNHRAQLVELESPTAVARTFLHEERVGARTRQLQRRHGDQQHRRGEEQSDQRDGDVEQALAARSSVEHARAPRSERARGIRRARSRPPIR